MCREPAGNGEIGGYQKKNALTKLQNYNLAGNMGILAQLAGPILYFRRTCVRVPTVYVRTASVNNACTVTQLQLQVYVTMLLKGQ